MSVRGLTVDATGTRRRLQALALEGWSVIALAELLRTSPQTVQRWRGDHRPHRLGRPGLQGVTVTRVTAARVAAVYRWAETHDCGSRRTARVIGDASRAGWAPRGAWTKAAIDDPTASPLRPAYRRASLADREFARLIAAGVSPQAAATCAEAVSWRWRRVSADRGVAA